MLLLLCWTDFDPFYFDAYCIFVLGVCIGEIGNCRELSEIVGISMIFRGGEKSRSLVRSRDMSNIGDIGDIGGK